MRDRIVMLLAVPPPAGAPGAFLKVATSSARDTCSGQHRPLSSVEAAPPLIAAQYPQWVQTRSP
jgi:hypothetical protein